MTVYSQLLESALGQAPSSGGESTPGNALVKLIECRQRRDSVASSRSGPGWVPAALANQLAYDAALVDLARHVGLVCDLSRFNQPSGERSRLEGALRSRGIHLVEFDGQAASATN
jgi:hypothetical protein